MKKRILFASLCIPALFAACTQDELAEVQKDVNREKINIELASQGISFGSSADTRMSADETGNNGVKYSWIATDKLGAAVLDGTKQGDINTDDIVNFNYAFNREGNDVEGSKFTAASPVMKGIYAFYHQYNASVSREKLAFKIDEEQVYDKVTGKSAAYQMAQYVKGISPAVDLTADGIGQAEAANLELPVKFANFGVPFKFEIKAKNLPAGGAKLKRIVITKNGSGKIANGGNLDFDKLAAAQADRVVVTKTKESDALETEFAEKVKATIDAVNKATIFADGTGSESIAVTVKDNGSEEGVALSGEAITVYVVMPNKNNKEEYDIKIQTSEGFYQRTGNFLFATKGGATTDSNDAGVVAPGEIELDFNTNGTGNIEQPTTFQIGTDYTWDSALAYINSHPALYMTIPVTFELTKDAEIDVKASASYPAFQNLNLTLKSNTHKLTVKNDNLTMKVSSWTFKDDAIIVLDDNKTMTVAGLPTLSANLTFENKGTLTLQGVKDATNLKVENYKTLNVTAESSLAELTNAADATTTVNAGTKLTVGNLGTAIGLGSGNATGAIDVKGELVITGATCTNAGTINVQSGATLTPNAALTNNGTINNAGTITAVNSTITNGTDGVINLKKGGVSNGASGVTYDASSGKGKIVIEDIADFVAIAAEGKYKFASGSKVTTEVKSYAEYKNALTVTDLSDITLNGGTWRIAESAVDANEVIAMPTSSISTKGDVTLMFDDNTAFTKALNLTVESGSVALKSVNNIGDANNETEVNSTATIEISNLTIKNGASMSVPASITVNAAASSNSAEANIGGTLTVDGKMYFNEAQVGAADNTVATLTLNPHEASKEAAVFGVQGTFNNYGTVSAATVNDTDVRGVVSAANNVGNGKIIGKWAEDGAIDWL